MIIRLFLILLLLNMVAFVVRAEAGENAVTVEDLYPDELPELQDRVSGDFRVNDGQDALFTLGARLLSWRFVEYSRKGARYASESIRPDHSIALLNEGASLNLRWRF
jgi:hypothetical protein